MITKKMKVEVWSDVTCVYCYIAKRKFESALSQFDYADSVEVIWKSFELAPGLSVPRDKSMYEFLAEHNRASVQQVKEICSQITSKANEVGLVYDFEIARPANSFMAHRLSYMAKHYGVQADTKEALFRAHFTEGKDLNDITTLIKLGVEIGMDQTAVRVALETDQYTVEVREDIQEAHQAGVKSVPLYRFNEKLQVSGVQDSERYLEILWGAYNEWKDNVGDPGQTCGIGGGCL